MIISEIARIEQAIEWQTKVVEAKVYLYPDVKQKSIYISGVVIVSIYIIRTVVLGPAATFTAFRPLCKINKQTTTKTIFRCCNACIEDWSH